MANTLGLIFASSFDSVGMHAVTGQKSGVSISFGVASYNMTNNEWGFLGKEGNSTLENIGYGLGALANLGDILAGMNPSNTELRTEKFANDYKGHSQLTVDGKIVVDYGPIPIEGKSKFGFPDGTNAYEGGELVKGSLDPIKITGANTNRLNSFGSSLSANPGKYNFALNSCVSQTSRALNLSGIFNIGIHPYILHAQMYLRSIGVRPSLYSYHLQQ